MLQSLEPRPRTAPCGGQRQSVSVVIPMLNEAGAIAALAQRLGGVLDVLQRPWDVVVVDDGSVDGTADALKALNARDPRFKAISLSRNFGKEVAVAAGLRHSAGDAVVIMDGDLQHPPEMIVKFIERWQEGYDVVYGQRMDRASDGALHRLFARLFYSVFRRLSGTELPSGAGDFRLLDRKAVDVLNQIGERSRFNKGLYAWIGFRSVGVPFDVAARVDGSSRWRLRKLMRFAFDGLASFSTMPLRVWSYVGLLISALAFAYVFVFLLKTLVWGVDVPGFPSLIVSVMLFAGVQLISLGVIGEYLGRVYEEVKGRPLFVVAERIGAVGTPPAASESVENARIET